MLTKGQSMTFEGEIYSQVIQHVMWRPLGGSASNRIVELFH